MPSTHFSALKFSMLLGHSKGNKDVSSGLGSVIVVKPRVVAARLRIEGVVVLKLQLAIPSAISAVLIVASPVGVISFTKLHNKIHHQSEH